MITKLLTPRKLILIFILINLICGLFIVSDYSRSPDEINEETRAKNAINGFSSWETFQRYRAQEKKILASAPSILFTLIENAASKVIQSPPGAIKHYLYLVSFQIGIYLFFLLAKKILNEWNALGMTLIFGTQPLFFGLAFITPKDVPFMAVFLATITSGIYMTDHLISRVSHSRRLEENGTTDSIIGDWSNLARGRRNILILSNLIWLLLYFVKTNAPFVLENLITQIYYSPDESIFRDLFLKIASGSDTISISAYIGKAQQLFDHLFIYLFIVCLILEICLLLRFLPSIKRWLWHSLIEPHTTTFRENKRGYLFPILIAGLAWGFCISSRMYGQIVGLAAGGLVGLYVLLKIKEKAIFPLILYSFFAGISLYLFWPNIWFTGFSGLLEALKSTMQFTWRGGVMYNGAIYPYDMLPRSYLPHLISIQFTEPVIVLGLSGFLLSLFLITRHKLDSIKFVLLSCWFFLPIIYSVVFQPTHYNNFRQYIFITPPLFIFAGISFNGIVQLIKRRWLVAILFVIAFLPGKLSLFQLHPYQYIYYNSFVGGVEGAFRRFEMDYWLISYKEAMEYLNQVAPQNAKILHWRDGEMLNYYSRDDLELTNQNTIDSRYLIDFDYGIVPSSLDADLKNLLFADMIFQVERDHAILVVVRKIK